MGSSPSVGDTIALAGGGRFDILRKIGHGGMAEIFLARKSTEGGFERVVVLKRILAHLGRDEQFVEMFTQEAKLAALLVHPNVAQVYEMGRDSEGTLFYAMEYVEGRDVRDIVKKFGRRLPLEIVLSIIAGAAAGLHHAHTLKDPRGNPLEVVHRDVTPSNLMVTYEGTVKVVDFGVAKAAVEGRESTAVGVLKGKVPYMSPEQVLIRPNLDGRSDVFSLGICLWELTTHRRLFRRSHPLESVRAISEEDAPLPSTIIEKYPKKLEEIVMKALARDRDERYSSARALQIDIEAFALENRHSLSASKMADFMGKWFESERTNEADLLAEGAASISEVITTMTPTTASQSVAAPVAAPVPVAVTAAQPAASDRRVPLALLAFGLIAGVGGIAAFALTSGGEDELPAPAPAAAAASGEAALAPAPTPLPDIEPAPDEPVPEVAVDPPVEGEDEGLVIEDDAADEDPGEPEEPLVEAAPDPEPDPPVVKKKRRTPRVTKKKKAASTWDKNSLLPPD